MASNYEQLVKALRCCSKDKCGQCEYEWNPNHGFCANSMCADAAAAIEELQAEVQELKRVNLEIFDDLPKRGEWITIRLNNGGSYTGCSCCEAPIPTDTMLDYIPESESKYCYSCGAKMEVQDGQE